jgi:replicative DNA helicase
MSLTDVVSKQQPANDAPKHTARPPRKANGDPTVSNFERCRSYVAKMDPAISGSGGHSATLDVVRVCTGFDLTPDETIDILNEYNERCQPPWSSKELAHKASYLGRFRKYECGYILDREQAWEPQQAAARAAMPPAAEAPDDLPPLWDEALDSGTVESEEPDPQYRGGGPAEDRQRKGFFDGAVDDLEKSTFACIERRRSGTEQPVLTPFREFNIALEGGLWPGLHTFTGGTGSWKTELAAATCSQAIDDGCAVVYVSLELEKEQVFIRIAARRAGVPWSRIWLGKYGDQDLVRVRAESERMRGKPFRVIEGTAGGWSSSQLYDLVKKARVAHPVGPLLVVLDFLQLIGANEGERVDLREKIGRTAYVARQVAREFAASVLLISSTARDKYSLLNSAMKEAGLSTMRAQHGGSVKTIINPHVLVGLGKESGEIEFACDSVTVMSKWPTRLDNGDRLVVLAVAKLRYGRESWCVLTAHGGTQLIEYPCQSLEELPQADSGTGGKEPVAEDEYVRRVVETVRLNPSRLRSSNDVRKRTKGDAPKVRDAFKRAMRDGLLTELEDGTLAVGESHS